MRQSNTVSTRQSKWPLFATVFALIAWTILFEITAFILDGGTFFPPTRNHLWRGPEQWLIVLGLDVACTFALFSIFEVIFRSLSWSISLTNLFQTLFISLNLVKLSVFNEVLRFTDYSLLGDLVSFYKRALLDLSLFRLVPTSVYIVLSLSILSFFIFRKLGRRLPTYPRTLSRFAYAILGVFFLANLLPTTVGQQMLGIKGLHNRIEWNLNRSSCRSHGYFACIWFMSYQAKLDPLSESEFISVNQYLRSHFQSTKRPGFTKSPADIVLVYFIESFWDPTQLSIPHLEDPIPHFRKLSQQQSSGAHISPRFGGGSILTQFELLTGVPLKYFSDEITRNITEKSLPSLATTFINFGYSTEAILADPPNEAYRQFGFQNLTFLSGILPNYKDPFISDEVVVRRILESIERNPKKRFIFADTLASHSPYSVLPGQAPRRFFSAGKGEETLDVLNGYSHAIRHADSWLQYLITQLSKRPERITILALGDHRPPLLNYLSDEPIFKSSRATPFLLWKNFGGKNIYPTHLETSDLAKLVYEESGLEVPLYLDGLKKPRSPPGEWIQLLIRGIVHSQIDPYVLH